MLGRPPCEFTIRFSSMPSFHLVTMVKEIHPASLNSKYVCFMGTILKRSTSSFYHKKRVYKCTACGADFNLEASRDLGFRFDMPSMCPVGNAPGAVKKKVYDPKLRRKKEVSC